MELKSSQKLDASFSLASMTDIIFQLLIFFMLTSSFVTPAALPVNLPSSVAAPTITPKVQITITSNLQYFVNEVPVAPENIEEEMKDALSRAREPIVVLNLDKDVAVQYMVRVASLANRLGAKVSIATKIDSGQ
ncbi:MAG: biopolymer transporter ExbD [Microscillaceae bacterium]|nr:biopolymer transporter ExbD [Microscillaceae bacterium]